jgi:dihydrolipoamide dehydrogenase
VALALESTLMEMVVSGAGYIGIELSTLFARLGTDVTVVDALFGASWVRRGLVEPVQANAERLGIDFKFGEAASEWYCDEDHVVVVTKGELGTTYEYSANSILVAVGREPVTDTVNLPGVGLEPIDQNFLETGEQARTDIDHIYAVGHVAGEPMLVHKVSAEGLVAAPTISGDPTTLEEAPCSRVHNAGNRHGRVHGRRSVRGWP